MKKIISIPVILLFVISFLGAVAEKKPATQAVSKAKVEVYYFHYSRRCVTCQAVEAETQRIIEALYPSQSRKGLITFQSLNLDEKKSDALSKKCNAEGQALLVISGNKRFDLTEQGFMYANSKPEKLKEELKKVIDPLF